MYADATDMVKSFTGLCGIIRGVFGDDPSDGSLFLVSFTTRRRPDQGAAAVGGKRVRDLVQAAGAGNVRGRAGGGS